MGLLSPSISTLALCLGLVNLGILYHAGVPVPPEPYLSLLGILIMNLMLFVKIPSVLGILADRQSGNQGHTTAGDPPLDLGRRDFVAEYKRLNTLCWTRYIVALQTWATLILKASVKDGRYSITVNRTLYDFVIGVGAGLLMFSAFVRKSVDEMCVAETQLT
jgi:hypothetical protein